MTSPAPLRMEDLPLPVRLRAMRAAFVGKKSMPRGEAARWIADNQDTVRRWVGEAAQ